MSGSYSKGKRKRVNTHKKAKTFKKQRIKIESYIPQTLVIATLKYMKFFIGKDARKIMRNNI